MIILVNYNKGAAITSVRNTQIIAVLYSIICPTLIYYLNDKLLHIPEDIITYIIVIIIATGILVYILSVVLLLFTLLSFGKPYTYKNSENT